MQKWEDMFSQEDTHHGYYCWKENDCPRFFFWVSEIYINFKLYNRDKFIVANMQGEIVWVEKLHAFDKVFLAKM